MEEHGRGTTAYRDPDVEDPISEAIRYLDERLCDPGLTASAVAERVGLDLWQFCRKFKSATGRTCSEFIAERRMSEAMRLLQRGDLLIKEVAYRVGFEDANYFSRRFKRVVGRSPSSFTRHEGARGPRN